MSLVAIPPAIKRSRTITEQFFLKNQNTNRYIRKNKDVDETTER